MLEAYADEGVYVMLSAWTGIISDAMASTSMKHTNAFDLKIFNLKHLLRFFCMYYNIFRPKNKGFPRIKNIVADLADKDYPMLLKLQRLLYMIFTKALHSLY